MRKFKLPIVLLILLGIVIFYFLIPKRNQPVTVSRGGLQPSQVVSLPSPDPEAGLAVSNFYKEYTDCLQNHPIQIESDVSVYCRENNSLIASDFKKNFEQQEAVSGIDPVICAQNLPLETSLIKQEIKDENNQIVYLKESFNASTEIVIPIEVTKQEQSWKVNKIICPKI